MAPDSKSSTPPNPPQPPRPQNTRNGRGKSIGELWSSGIVSLQPRKVSDATDERCLTYCRQTAKGRMFKHEPSCHTICTRKIFMHEVRNILGITKHSVGADGRAKYPLHPHGQPFEYGPSASDANFWEKGWYVWFSRSRAAAFERLSMMSWDLERQSRWIKQQEERRLEWIAWSKRRQTAKYGETEEPPSEKPYPISDGLLLRLASPIRQVQSLMEPTYKVFGTLHESIESGTHRRFAGRLWDKAWTAEPFKLAADSCSKMWEMWKNRRNGV